MTPLKICVLYGGRSGEHEISLRSAASVVKNLDPARYQVTAVGIDKSGRWHVQRSLEYGKTKELADILSL
ncbi:MAG TPA: D-alanine--D-alanine ligase A, partial [Spirochaetia bacterium]|nr:D-alanine--D-alanine ligase A [Spirochaetia bacterium]